MNHTDDELADAVEAALKNHRVFKRDTLLGTYKHCELGTGAALRMHGCDAKLMAWARDLFIMFNDHEGSAGYKTKIELRELSGSKMTLIGAWVSAAAHDKGMLTLAFDNYTTESM